MTTEDYNPMPYDPKRSYTHLEYARPYEVRPRPHASLVQPRDPFAVYPSRSRRAVREACKLILWACVLSALVIVGVGWVACLQVAP